MRIRVSARQLGDRHFQICLSSRIAIITQSLLRPGKGGRMARVKAAYFGFASHDEAIRFANEIRGRFPKARLEVRQAQRLQAAFEVKVIGDFVEKLAWEIVQRSETTSQRIERHLQLVRCRPASQPIMPSASRTSGRTMVAAAGHLVGID